MRNCDVALALDKKVLKKLHMRRFRMHVLLRSVWTSCSARTCYFNFSPRKKKLWTANLLHRGHNLSDFDVPYPTKLPEFLSFLCHNSSVSPCVWWIVWLAFVKKVHCGTKLYMFIVRTGICTYVFHSKQREQAKHEIRAQIDTTYIFLFCSTVALLLDGRSLALYECAIMTGKYPHSQLQRKICSGPMGVEFWTLGPVYNE